MFAFGSNGYKSNEQAKHANVKADRTGQRLEAGTERVVYRFRSEILKKGDVKSIPFERETTRTN